MPNLRPKIQDYRLGLVYGGAYLNFLVICSHWNKITPTLSSPPSSPVTGNQELNPDTISFDGSNYVTLTGESSCLIFSSFVLKMSPSGFWKLFRFDSKGQRRKKNGQGRYQEPFQKHWSLMAQFDALIRSTLDILGLCMWEWVAESSFTSRYAVWPGKVQPVLFFFLRILERQQSTDCEYRITFL